MTDILIKNGVLIPVDPDRRIIADGAVAIKGDRIVAVGPTEDVERDFPCETVIDARGKAILPGLIDSHSHAGHGLVKNIGGGRSDLWYEACEAAYTVGSTPDFWRADAQLVALERLRFGVTTSVSLLGGGDTVLRTDFPEYGDAHCEGIVEVGTRGMVAVGSTRPPFPQTYASWSGEERTEYEVTFEQMVDTSRSLIERWHNSHNGRIMTALVTPPLRQDHKTGMDAADYETAVTQIKHMHAMSLDYDVIYMQDGHQNGSIKMAQEFGILGPKTLLSHSINLWPEEIGICADTGACVVHNPTSIAAILGRCPAPELIDAGVTVALGTDATSPDRSGDMFKTMQQCMHYHRTFFADTSWLPPGKVLEMCTIDAARALGIENEVGSLEVGKKADVILIDLRRPHLYPANMPEFRVVYFANGNDVHTVIVDGRIVLQDRKAQFVDEDSILDAAQRETENMIRRLGLKKHLETPPSFWGHARDMEQAELAKLRGWFSNR